MHRGASTYHRRHLHRDLLLLAFSLASAWGFCTPVTGQENRVEDLATLEARVEAHELREAQYGLENYVRAHPEDAYAWELLGRAQMGRWLFDDATDSYQKAMDLGRENARLLREWIESKGRSTSRLSLVFKAKSLKDAALRALELDPYDVETRAALAAYYYVVPGFLGGDKDRADRLVRELVELSPADGYYLMGRRAQEEDAPSDTILADWHRALEIDPEHTLTLLDLGAFWTDRDSIALGLSYYRRAAASAPEDAQIRTSYARAFRNARMYEETERQFLRALEIDPYWAPARLNLAEHYERHGTKEQAIREYSMLARNNPTYRERDVRKRLRKLMGG
jgi:tetratricopeptide (TPR) repeat protein